MKKIFESEFSTTFGNLDLFIKDTMSTTYVNEKTGVDSAEQPGSESQPYATPAYALFVNPDAKILVYKETEEDKAQFAYTEISPSALKKPRKELKA